MVSLLYQKMFKLINFNGENSFSFFYLLFSLKWTFFNYFFCQKSRKFVFQDSWNLFCRMGRK